MTFYPFPALSPSNINRFNIFIFKQPLDRIVHIKAVRQFHIQSDLYALIPYLLN